MFAKVVVMAEVPATAEVVVIGGGVMGTSALYHLAAAGCHDAVLLERDTLGSGSTGAAAGGIRAQFSDELNVRVALECIARFTRFEEEIGTDIGFHQSGYLFLLRSGEVAAFESSVELQRSLGVPTELLSPDHAADLVPQLSLDGIAAATFCPLDGCADPGATVQGYADAARRLGARVVQGTSVEQILVDAGGGRIVGVETTRGTIATPSVICAAGVDARLLATPLGVELPVEPERRYVHMVAGPDPLPATLPLTVDFATGLYLHRASSQASTRPLLLGGPFATADDLAPVVLERLPAMADLTIRPGWSGDYEMSPDHNAIVGGAREPQGFFYATGFSGHGYQQAPVIGDYLADLVLGRPPALDLSPLSVDRFTSETFRTEANVI
jgi:sarcosine oxidase subunit beta